MEKVYVFYLFYLYLSFFCCMFAVEYGLFILFLIVFYVLLDWKKDENIHNETA